MESVFLTWLYLWWPALDSSCLPSAELHRCSLHLGHLSAPPLGAFSSPWSGEGRAWPQMTRLLSSVLANLEERENVPFLGPNLSPVGQDSDRPGWGLSPPGHWPGRNWSCALNGPSSRNTSVLTRKRVGVCHASYVLQNLFLMVFNFVFYFLMNAFCNIF